MEKRFVIIIALCALVVSSWMLTQNGEPKEEDQATSDAADFFADKLVLTTFNAEGQLNQRMTADKLLHFPENKSTELTNPQVTVFNGEKPPWQVNAKRGKVSDDGEQVLLSGGVTIDRPADSEEPPLHVVTDNLHIQPKNNYLETDNKVHLTSLNNQVEATGLQAWFNPSVRIKLLAEARGHYEVQ
ncbi:MAG: LPS export ABC transporter periplasmic protein LptC [Chromatiales bacterium]|nr:LPS export ABC transporter periplasmic protein LptC [Chromatiales bacterium]